VQPPIRHLVCLALCKHKCFFSNCLKTALVAFGLWIAYRRLFQVDGPILDNWNNSEKIVVPRRSYYRAEMCSSLSCHNANDKCRHTQQNAVHHVPDLWETASWSVILHICHMLHASTAHVCGTAHCLMYKYVTLDMNYSNTSRKHFYLDLCDLFFCYDASKKCVY